MRDIIGAATGMIDGSVSARPTMEYVIQDFRDDGHLLRAWGQIARCTFEWQPRWGETHRVVSAKHPTMEAAEQQAAEMALRSGYEPPKWWEFWRMGERKLPLSP